MLLVLGSLLGLGLVAIEAPLWLFYLAPLLSLPFLIHELRRLERGPEPQAGGRAALRTGFEGTLQQSSATSVVILPDDGHWIVQKPGISRPGRRFDSQADAMDAARGYLRELGGGEMVTKDRDGRIHAKDTIRPKRRRR
jgi:hypothetical protein